MNGLYNIVHGENPFATVLLAVLGITRHGVPRYRDCYWTGEHIAVYTRTGGGNRDSYENPQRRKANYPELYPTEEEVNAGPFNEDLRRLPGYVRDEDDDFDSTYATFYFTVPEKLAWVIPLLKAETMTPKERWTTFLNKLNDPAQKDDTQVRRSLEALKPLMEQLEKALKGQP